MASCVGDKGRTMWWDAGTELRLVMLTNSGLSSCTMSTVTCVTLLTCSVHSKPAYSSLASAIRARSRYNINKAELVVLPFSEKVFGLPITSGNVVDFKFSASVVLVWMSSLDAVIVVSYTLAP